MRSTPKAQRHHRILELIAREPMVTQEDMVKRLSQQGLRVTQATLSRDIKELGLVKTAEGYVAPGDLAEAETTGPSLEHLLREFVVDVREAQNLLVVKTSPGSAQPVAAALDAENWPETVGTIAGDDTILVVSPDNRSRRALAAKIRDAMG
ncbi:MAG: arginine repressor [Terriglobales bacterium]